MCKIEYFMTMRKSKIDILVFDYKEQINDDI